MVTRNIYTQTGLVNGAMDTVQSLQFSATSEVIVIFVLFDNPHVGRIIHDDSMHIPVCIEKIELFPLFD